MAITEMNTELRLGRLRWYGHVMRRPDDHVLSKCHSMATRRRGKGRAQTSWMTNVRKDIQNLGRTDDDDARQRSEWR